MLHHRPLSLLLPLLFAALPFAACSVYTAPRCQSGSECPSGVCNVDGTCAEGDTTSSGTTSGGTTTGSGGSSSGTGGQSSTSGTGGSSTGTGGTGTGGGNACSPNNDGTITRAEVPLAAGLHATFKAAEDATVDTAGKLQGDGTKLWDLDVSLPGDHASIVETLPIEGQWFAADFAGATYASRLSDKSDLLGVFELTDSALLLRGVVSPVKDPISGTELTYATPIKILDFPLTVGKTWSTTSVITGSASGATCFGIACSESYDDKIDQKGTLKTPFATFQVVRLRVDLTRNIGGLVTTSRSYFFVTECFGIVAKMVSKDYESSDEFTTAAEVTRLSP
ncbi:MAG: hypothetical protein U0359_31310 [Byssovorax sp.]